jgi:hypothetical protein
MEDLDTIRNFEYRQPRMSTGFDVEVVAGGETIRGFCRDVSDAGIRAEFDGPVIAGSSGLLILRHPLGILKLDAQVAYIEKHQVGLVFHFHSPWERTMTIEFIASVAGHTGNWPVARLPE